MAATPKNIQFTRVIKTGGRLREFNFRRSEGLHNTMFTVDVASDRNDRLYIIYRYKKGKWILENKSLISWIEEVLPQIESLIEGYK